MTDASFRTLLAPTAALAAAAALAVSGAALVAPATAGPSPVRPSTIRAAGVAHPSRRAAAVTVADMAFSPASVSSAPGGQVTWTFKDTVAHTTTSDQGFWDSGPEATGATYTRSFTSAGTFGYHCTIHPMMHGTVRVPVATRGTTRKGYRLTWSTATGATYDVQTRQGGNAWVYLTRATAGTHARFDPAGAGTYSVRARTTQGGSRSGWSPVVTVTSS